MARFSRPATLAAATAIGLTAAPAQAESWGDFFNAFTPSRIVEQFLQGAIIGLRSQMDIQYGALTANALSGTVTITDVQIWPFPDWDMDGNCDIWLDRLTMRGTPAEVADTLSASLTLTGISLHPDCLPPDARAGLEPVLGDRISIPQQRAEISYYMPRASAQVTAHTTWDGIAAVTLDADFSYVSMDGRDTPSDPVPVLFLNYAGLMVENLGGWETVSPMLPPPFLDPAMAEPMITGMLTQALSEMNQDPTTGAVAPLSPSQDAFIASGVTAWKAFLANPQALVVETGMSLGIGNDVYVDVLAYEDDPALMFEDLTPRFATATARSRDILPVELITMAMTRPAELSVEARKQSGLALLTGKGAPRFVAKGLELLDPLARDGDGEAALELARALQQNAPEDAYRYALIAGQDFMVGATAILDRLETRLPFATVLDLQAARSKGQPDVPLTALPDLRAAALSRVSGVGASRDYALAVKWAMIAAAAGDPEGAAILDELDLRARATGEDGRAKWQSVEAAASQAALDLWMGSNLPKVLSNR